MPAAPKPVSPAALLKGARDHLKAEHPVQGPFAPIVMAALQALLPLLIKWLTDKFDVVPKQSAPTP